MTCEVEVPAAERDSAVASGWPARAARVVAIYGAAAALIVAEVPLCPMAKLVHQPCPGCGLTRATLELAHGEIMAALTLHPLSIIISPLFVFVVLKMTKSYLWTGRMFPKREPKWVYPAWGVLCLLMIALWAARFFGAFGGPVAV